MPTRLPSILIALLFAWWVSPGQTTDETLATTKDPDRYLNYSTLAPLTEPETIHFDVDNFVDAILKANKKNIVYKINDQLNNFYDNQTTFVHQNKITYEQYIAKDEERDEKMIFVNKAFRSGILNHVLNVEVAMFHDMFQNHKVIFKDEEHLLKT
ncbi:hypothetical protein M8J76_005790 [Diaphorina citri]|nr:hypothetical protein M8J76_005790 [Diaphorina citri]